MRASTVRRPHARWSKRRGAAAVLLGMLSAACGGGDGSSDPCAGVACSSRGFCIAAAGTAYCVCISGYRPEGQTACVAIEASNPCSGIACSGHGTCRMEAGRPVCDCASGFAHLVAPIDVCYGGGCDLICVPASETDGGDVPTCHAGTSERCNGFDDDCDGLTDETFDLDFDPLNCGTCGTICSVGVHATPECVLGSCEPRCEAGWSNLDGSTATGCEAVCVPGGTPDETSCEGRDDDCDGRTDEDWSDTVACGTGFCARTAICTGGGVVCRPRDPPADTDGTCDGVDDDCDGTTDEDCSTTDGGPDADARDDSGETDDDGEADGTGETDDTGGADDAAGETTGPVCGDGVVEGSEDCDPPGSSWSCGNCGLGTQFCNSDCTRSGCDGGGDCSPGETQGCGDCGGQTCDGDCSWGGCGCSFHSEVCGSYTRFDDSCPRCPDSGPCAWDCDMRQECSSSTGCSDGACVETTTCSFIACE